VWSVFVLAVRAAVWRSTTDPRLVGLPSLLGWTAVLAAVRIALQYLDAGPVANFNPYGLNAVVAVLALELAIAALFVRPAGRATALAAMFVLSLIAEILTEAIRLALPLLASATGRTEFWTGATTAGVAFATEVLWWIGAMVCAIRSLEQQNRLPLIGKVAALWAALFIGNALVPYAPVFLAPGFDIRNANWWEIFHARYAAGTAQARGSDVKRIEQSQAALLQAEVAKLAPQRQGVTDIYALGIAGWANQDVFVKELDGGLAALASVLPIKDRTIRLINHRETLATVPLANPQNFAAAVHAVGEVMDKDEDVLVLLMTSHGDQHGFMLEVPGGRIELTPDEVASTLDKEGIKNRVVIVSACYAGIFLPPLANDNTIVMTAADAKNTSFGCAPERDWTYFGDAFFRQSLRPGADFEAAFDHARILIHGWEMMDNVPPSNPQSSFGAALVAKLAPLYTTAPANAAR
jgi:hypothetical protein